MGDRTGPPISWGLQITYMQSTREKGPSSEFRFSKSPACFHRFGFHGKATLPASPHSLWLPSKETACVYFPSAAGHCQVPAAVVPFVFTSQQAATLDWLLAREARAKTGTSRLARRCGKQQQQRARRGLKLHWIPQTTSRQASYFCLFLIMRSHVCL